MYGENGLILTGTHTNMKMVYFISLTRYNHSLRIVKAQEKKMFGK